jgi:hypothetical protein
MRRSCSDSLLTASQSDGIFGSDSFPVVLGIAHQHADPPHLLALLRLRCKRPRRRAAEQRDKLTA